MGRVGRHMHTPLALHASCCTHSADRNPLPSCPAARAPQPQRAIASRPRTARKRSCWPRLARRAKLFSGVVGSAGGHKAQPRHTRQGAACASSHAHQRPCRVPHCHPHHPRTACPAGLQQRGGAGQGCGCGADWRGGCADIQHAPAKPARLSHHARYQRTCCEAGAALDGVKGCRLRRFPRPAPLQRPLRQAKGRPVKRDHPAAGKGGIPPSGGWEAAAAAAGCRRSVGSSSAAAGCSDKGAAWQRARLHPVASASGCIVSLKLKVD